MWRETIAQKLNFLVEPKISLFKFPPRHASAGI